MHLDPVQVSVLAITDLESDLSLETGLPFDFHQVGKNGSPMGIEVSFSAVKSKDRFVQDGQRNLFEGSGANAAPFGINSQVTDTGRPFQAIVAGGSGTDDLDG